jgi:hypothetical protein
LASGAVSRANIASGALSFTPALNVRVKLMKVLVPPQTVVPAFGICAADEIYAGTACDNTGSGLDLQVVAQYFTINSDGVFEQFNCTFKNNSSSKSYTGTLQIACAKMSAMSVP